MQIWKSPNMFVLILKIIQLLDREVRNIFKN